VSTCQRKVKLFKVAVNGTIQLYPDTNGWFLTLPPFDSDEARAELRRRLTQAGQPFSAEDLLKVKGPKIYLSSLSTPDRIQSFLDTFEWVVHQLNE